MTTEMLPIFKRSYLNASVPAHPGWLASATSARVRPGQRARGLLLGVLVLALGWCCHPESHAQAGKSPSGASTRRDADYIVAIVNQELVTNSEVQQRLARVIQESGSTPSAAAREELERRVLDQLIDERAQLSYARETGIRVDETELDRAVNAVAAQNELSAADLRERLRKEGLDYGRFRTNLRDQMLLERVREREVQSRIRIGDRDIENWLAQERVRTGLSNEYNIAQILITIPDNAGPAEVAVRRSRAVDVLQRLRGGADFGALVKEFSEGSKDKGGQLGMRPASRLPDLFVDAVQALLPGEVAPQVLRSGAGFHVLKLIERQDAALTVTQHHARHILLRPGPKLTVDTAVRRLNGYKRDIDAGRARFEDLARRHSEDGSAPNGGDLGWAGPGQFVPEFEQALAGLGPNQVSEPVVSRFGVHLIQLLERRSIALDTRQQRESARTALREQKFGDAYAEWARDVRARAFVELREPPQQ